MKQKWVKYLNSLLKLFSKILPINQNKLSVWHNSEHFFTDENEKIQKPFFPKQKNKKVNFYNIFF